MDTIDALGEKMDPLAVDALIGKFSHPHPLIWYSVASAVGRIAGHRDTPEPIRSEIFSKLVNLLSHENPQVRKTAATALGYMAGRFCRQSRSCDCLKIRKHQCDKPECL